MARAFPVVYAQDVERSARFYVELLGFGEFFRLPAEGAPGYIGLRLEDSRLGVVSHTWPEQMFGGRTGSGARFELFVYVADVDATVERVRQAGGLVHRAAEDMPWGERVAYVADPDGNP